jgi:hypothetical protein
MPYSWLMVQRPQAWFEIVENHFDIILIATPQSAVAYLFRSGKDRERSVTWEQLLSCLSHGQRRITLVWDWASDSELTCHRELLAAFDPETFKQLQCLRLFSSTPAYELLRVILKQLRWVYLGIAARLLSEDT